MPPVTLDPDGSGTSELIFRTRGKDWILVADPAVSRDSFLRLASVAMSHALDHGDMPAETGLVFHTIPDELKAASDRLHVGNFPVKKTEEKPLCGFCGSSMTAAAKVKGWQGCARCQRLLKEQATVHLCRYCLASFGASPEIEKAAAELLAKDGTQLPDLTLCPTCRSIDRQQKVSLLDLMIRAVGEGRVTVDQLKAIKVPGEYLQLLRLRTQTRRG